MFTEENLKKLFTNGFKKKLKESLIPFDSINKEKIIRNLVKEIRTYTYHPSPPRDYIVFNKHNGVARIVPSFTAKDYFLYYTCVKFIEDELAQNRVEGTYGGWRLGNKIMLIEQQEEQELIIENYVNNSFNPFLWTENWTDFQKKAALYAENYEFMLFIDIVNFYDSIDLNLLKRKIFLAVPREKYQAIELLFYFLENWNKIFEGYSRKNVGLPQDEFGDNSRLLANFYLQDYDEKIKEVCNRSGINYLRYADDMIFYANDKNQLESILFEACKELYKIGLNINSGKIKFFDRDQFNKYWAFEIFNKFKEEKNDEGVKLFFKFKDDDINFRENSVLKKILNIKNFTLLRNDLQRRLISEFFKEDFLSHLDQWYFKKIYNILNKDQKGEFIVKLQQLSKKVLFNSFHYNILLFFKKEGIKHNAEEIKKMIEKLKL